MHASKKRFVVGIFGSCRGDDALRGAGWRASGLQALQNVACRHHCSTPWIDSKRLKASAVGMTVTAQVQMAFILVADHPTHKREVYWCGGLTWSFRPHEGAAW